MMRVLAAARFYCEPVKTNFGTFREEFVVWYRVRFIFAVPDGDSVHRITLADFLLPYLYGVVQMRGAICEENVYMAQAMETPIVQNTPALEKRVEELETVLRKVLEQINTHQIYDKDARSLIKKALGSSQLTESIPAPPPPVRRQGEFPSLFPSAASSNFI